ncbi:nucleotidyltransferase domain-containing protein [Candidatus Hecatella orcuttiae]|uniref:nucleotidyltransferase domain-containing protein n=1 Tax=Candidatus Hecatella orcuttiae TaxID=1935119 RepID=UPI002868344C|nr:nucleotidyltransferase domain-containing protein [Candidatus Hecatella orcuttiae]
MVELGLQPMEGDHLETFQGVIFSVKGPLHPPGYVVAFPKYYPSPEGSRVRGGRRYAKLVSLKDFYSYVERNCPQYLRFDPVLGGEVIQVPRFHIARYHTPTQALAQLAEKDKLDPVEKDILQMALFFKEAAGIPLSDLGVSGSVMLGLHSSTSDIDLVIYGEENCRKAYRVLSQLRGKEGAPIQPFTDGELAGLYQSRVADTPMDFELFLQVEKRKVLQGKFCGRGYSLRLLKKRGELGEEYGAVKYRPLGSVEIEAVVAEDGEAVFTPCRYLLEEVSFLRGEAPGLVAEIVSHRGRFCEQARRWEKIRVLGKLEKVVSSERERFRLLVGSAPGDFFFPLPPLEGVRSRAERRQSGQLEK